MWPTGEFMTVFFYKYIPGRLACCTVKIDLRDTVFSASGSLVSTVFHVFWEMLVWKQEEEEEEENMAKAKAILHVLLHPQVTHQPHS